MTRAASPRDDDVRFPRLPNPPARPPDRCDVTGCDAPIEAFTRRRRRRAREGAFRRRCRRVGAAWSICLRFRRRCFRCVVHRDAGEEERPKRPILFVVFVVFVVSSVVSTAAVPRRTSSTEDEGGLFETFFVWLLTMLGTAAADNNLRTRRLVDGSETHPSLEFIVRIDGRRTVMDRGTTGGASIAVGVVFGERAHNVLHVWMLGT